MEMTEPSNGKEEGGEEEDQMKSKKRNDTVEEETITESGRIEEEEVGKSLCECRGVSLPE